MLLFEQVCFSYPGAKKTALSSVSFSVSSGEHVVLLGCNGSGKSTLARLANGLLLPDSGSVTVNNKLTSNRATIREIRAQLGVVAQNPDNQIVSTTALDEVAFGLENLGVEREEMHARATAALEAMGLSGYEERDPHTLSGGEKQRLIIASLLAMNPTFLVLDEPTSMLDKTGRAEVQKAIDSLHAQGHGILHITHNLSLAKQADRALVLLDGALVFVGSPSELLENDKLLIAYRLKAVKMDNGAEKGKTATMDKTAAMDKTEEMDEEAVQITPSPPASVSTAISTPAPIVPAIATALGSIATSALELHGICYAYGDTSADKYTVLKGINLSIASGSFTLISGSTGAGKSTLLRILAGLLEPTEGRACFFPEKEIVPGDVGIVFQHPETQLFAKTVEEEILFGPLNKGMVSTKTEQENCVLKALGAVGLDAQSFLGRSPFTLSGGEMRRLAIAGILAMQPAFLLLDEPTAGLDAQGRAFVHRLLAHLVRAGTGIVVVSHDTEEFVPRAQTHLTLRGGQLWHS